MKTREDRDTVAVYNTFEVILWGILAAVFLLRGVARRPGRRRSLIAAATFALFAVSDMVEIGTGAWWRPWWLLLWKGACLVVFAVLGLMCLREIRKQ